MTEPRFFKSQKEWRAWLTKNHATATELLLGFHKASSDEKGITYKEALDEALAFGWIDAVRAGGDKTWTIRFTRRKARSIWSAVNIKRIAKLKAEGRMHTAGLAAFEARDPKLQKKYSFENPDAKLSPADAKRFRADKQAWANFERMPPSYRHPAIWWVVSAKQEATRERRLATLIADSAAGVRLKHLRRPGKSA
ncbi:MAG: YdeI/OmpD-associated family protein [Bauldia sp.]